MHNQIDIGFLIIGMVAEGVTIHPKGETNQIVRPVLFSRGSMIGSMSVNTVYDENGVAHYLELTTNLAGVGMSGSAPNPRKHSFLFSRSNMNEYEISGMMMKAHSFILSALQNPGYGYGEGVYTQSGHGTAHGPYGQSRGPQQDNSQWNPTNDQGWN